MGINRLIRYRGVSKKTKEWVYGYSIKHIKHGHIIYNPANQIAHKIYSKTVGMYTGFIDIDNLYIYEGDLLKHNGGLIFQYRWDGGQGRYYIADEDGFYVPEFDGVNNSKSLYDSNSKIIGTIHDEEIKTLRNIP